MRESEDCAEGKRLDNFSSGWKKEMMKITYSGHSYHLGISFIGLLPNSRIRLFLPFLKLFPFFVKLCETLKIKNFFVDHPALVIYLLPCHGSCGIEPPWNILHLLPVHGSRGTILGCIQLFAAAEGS